MGEKESRSRPTIDPRATLCTWANERDAWVRRVTELVVASGTDLSSDDVDEVYSGLLIEKGFVEGPLVPVPDLAVNDQNRAQALPLTLEALDQVRGVNALDEGHRIEFNQAITVLFGQNASGKSGYARVLKHIAAARTADEILPNVHKATDANEVPSARIEFTLGDEQLTRDWNGELGIKPLTRTSVFDSPAVNIHVDQKLGYVYTPAELGLFASVTRSIKAIQAVLNNEINALQPADNPFPRSFEQGSSVHSIIEHLGAGTSVSELRNLSNLSESEEKNLEELASAVAALKAGTQRTLLDEARRRRTQAEALAGIYDKAAKFRRTEYEARRAELLGATRASEKLRESLFADDTLGVGGVDDDWQEFIAAANQYQKHIGHDDYPDRLDECPYCKQELSDPAKELLSRYRHFLSGSLQSAITEQEQSVDQAALALAKTDIARVRAMLEPLSEESDEFKWMTEGVEFLSQAEEVLSATKERLESPSGLSHSAAVNLVEINKVVVSLTSRVNALTNESDNETETLRDFESRLRELNARKRLYELLPQITTHIEMASRSANLEALSQQVSNSVLRSLTEASKSASDDVMNRRFAELFSEECKLLGARDVALEFHGRSGQTERHKAVADYKPSRVLSEGEQKVLALADFLAECRMRQVRTPIVFDDPVTSLDYRRVDEVARRIVELAKTHQVIVFTHNIMFAVKLIDHRQRKSERCTFYEVRDEGKRKGIIGPDFEPRLDTPQLVGRQIDSNLDLARSAEPARQDALLSTTIGLVRKWLEVFVEQELLSGVVQRYRSNVRLGSLTKIKVDKLGPIIEVVDRAFELTSQHIEGHSRADEQVNVHLTIDDLDRLWGELTDVRAKLQA